MTLMVHIRKTIRSWTGEGIGDIINRENDFRRIDGKRSQFVGRWEYRKFGTGCARGYERAEVTRNRAVNIPVRWFLVSALVLVMPIRRKPCQVRMRIIYVISYSDIISD